MKSGAISVRGVRHWFSSGRDSFRQVLDDVSFDVAPGEFVALVGPSGCGKTTLLNMIAGFQPVYQGEVTIDAKPVNRIQAGKVAFMFATDNLLPWRSALANVTLPLEIGATTSRRDRVDRARQLLERVGLAGFEDYSVARLSQGMRQRVALARTLATDASVILMDEPFGALDAQTRVVVQNEFSRVWETTGRTVLLVTHDLTEAIALADRVVVMSARPGRVKSQYVISIPRPRVVFDLPSNPDYVRLLAAIWQDLRQNLVDVSPLQQTDRSSGEGVA